MSDPAYEKVQKEGRARALSTAVWDSRFCTKELWDYLLATIPHDAIGADMTKHADHGSYSPKLWYQDQRFKCRDCGRIEVWTAESQRWWFEVAKGTIYASAVRCRPCRKALRQKSGNLSMPQLP